MERNLITAPPKLRYKINTYLAALQPTVRSKVKARIRRRCNNIAESTLSRWCNVLSTDSADIPATALFEIADALNVTVFDLVND